MIGIFDSGIGGLTVLQEIVRQNHQQSFVYIADSAFTPYGDKSVEVITNRCDLIVQKLIDEGADIIVVACNTATALAVDSLRNKYSLPIVAMEPAIKPAVKRSRQKTVGILATTRTLSSERYAQLLEKFTQTTDVYEQACTGLVEKVEQMQLEDQQTSALLIQYLKPLIEKNIDTIVLGCTHYPLLKEQIQTICGEQIHIIDTASAVTQEVNRKISENNIDDSKSCQTFYTTGDIEHFQKQLNKYWPFAATAQKINLSLIKS